MAVDDPQRIPPPSDAPDADTGQPGGGKGRIDVTGVLPDDIRVDPNVTEGQPGYEESGDSEIRVKEKETAERKDAPA